MRFLQEIARRALLAAACLLVTGSHLLAADPSATVDDASGTVLITGLAATDRDALQSEPNRIRLRVAGLETRASMALEVSTTGEAITIAPRFPLVAGRMYELTLDLVEGERRFDIAPPDKAITTPKVVGFEPSQAVIPANTLRLYLTFSEPMSQGNLRDAVTLLRSDGTEVPNPFLTLGPELWDPTQTRLTLLLDPGRIKQGVGPNRSHGAPLIEGERYRLVVDPSMESAAGVSLARPAHIALRVGPAEFDPIVPDTWQILAPLVGTGAPLTLAFDRIIDTGAARRMITVRDSADRLVTGVIETDGGGWSLMPARPWAPGTYRIIIDPELEDISGNAIGQAFDAPAGTIGTREKPVILTVRIGA